MLTAMSARLSRTIVSSGDILLIPLAAAACGSIPADKDTFPVEVWEGTWQGDPWDNVSDMTFARGPCLQSVTGNITPLV